MTKAKKKAPKMRATVYEKPMKFEGTFEDMIAMSAIVAGVHQSRN